MIKTITDKAINYLLEKQCSNGGFCFYKMEYLEEPNPRDTFFAVKSFLILAKEIPHRQQIKSYLWQIVNSNSVFSNLYFPLFTLKELGELQLNHQLQAIIASFPLSLLKETNPQVVQEFLLARF